jgi:hypothetical protein
MAVDGTSAPGARNFPLPVSPQAGTPTGIPRARACGAKIRGSGRGALRSPLAAPARTIKQVGKTVRVSICANYPFKDDKGQWKDDAHWNEVTIFTKSIQSYVSEHVSKGDLVHVRGRLRQNSFERDGQRIYTVDLIALELGRLAQTSERAAA